MLPKSDFAQFPCPALILTLSLTFALPHSAIGGQQELGEQQKLLSVVSQTIEAEVLARSEGVKFSLGILVGGRSHFVTSTHSGGRVVSSKEGTWIFEVGSITKLFTANLILQLADAGQLGIDQTLGEILKIPLNERAKNISVRDLLQHRSGLPVMPDSFFESGYPENNPYANFSREELLKYLAGEVAGSQERGEFVYSNLGFAILGLVLEEVSGEPFSVLLRGKIKKPLALDDTWLDRTLATEYLTHGQSATGEEVSYWDLNALAPAGGLVSSTKDLLTYLESALQKKKHPFWRMISDTEARSAQTDQGLSWMILKSRSGKRYPFHAGATGGFSSIVVVDTASRSAVVLLTNEETVGSKVEVVGFRLMKQVLDSLDTPPEQAPLPNGAP